MTNNSRVLINAEISSVEQSIADIRANYPNWFFCSKLPFFSWFVPQAVDYELFKSNHQEENLNKVKNFIDDFNLTDGLFVEQVLRCGEKSKVSGKQTEGLYDCADFAHNAFADTLTVEEDSQLLTVAFANTSL